MTAIRIDRANYRDATAPPAPIIIVPAVRFISFIRPVLSKKRRAREAIKAIKRRNATGYSDHGHSHYNRIFA